MIKFAEFEYNWRDFLGLFLLFFFIIVGFWNISLFSLPILLILVAFTFSILQSPTFRMRWLPRFSWVDASLGLLLLLELFYFQTSIYPANSLLGIEKVMFFIFIYYLSRIFLQKIKYAKVFFIGMGIYAFLLSLGAFFIFLFLQTALKIEGWNDASQFKRLFSPYGLLNNEWATIAIGLLPFPLLGAIYFKSSKTILTISALAFACVNASVLVTSSRGAYLSLVLFWIISISAILFLKLFPFKLLLKYIIIPFLLTTLFILPIRTPFFTTSAMNRTVSQQRSTQGRMDIMKNSFCQAQGHLILGVGSNNYPIINHLCKTNREDQGYSGFTNNTYLQILLEKGIIGVIGYTFLFFSLLISIKNMISRSNNSQERLLLVIICSGLCSLAFRELFFSTLFYSQGVLLLTAVLMGSSQSFKPLQAQAVKFTDYRIWIIIANIFIITNGWLLYQSNKARQAALAVAKSVEFWQLQQQAEAKKQLKKTLQLMPEVAPYHALEGLMMGQRNAQMDVTLAGKLPPQQSVKRSITSYQKALILNPYDAGYHFNLAWLHYWEENRDTAQIFNHLNKALSLEPNASEYQIGAGLLLEFGWQDTTAAFLHYERALRISPELLDAPFFKDIQQRNPLLASSLITSVTQYLKNQLTTNYNIILAARLGKFLLTTGDTIAAKSSLQQVLQALPDLNRPYYYLATIALQERDTALTINLLRKSIYLENTDFLPNLALGNIYFNQYDTQKAAARNAIQYYKQALRSWLSEKTLNSGHASIRYLQAVNINNDLVIPSLLHYCKASIDVKTIVQRIAFLYHKIGMDEEAKHYKNLVNKAPENILLSDLQ